MPRTAVKHSLLSRSAARSDATEVERPPIWIDGRQQPKFAFGPWLTVGQTMARRWVLPHLGAGSARLQALGGQIAAGRFAMSLSALGRAARLVPSRRTLGDLVTGFGLRLADARLILDPSAATPERLAYPDLIRVVEKPAPRAAAATISPSIAPDPRRRDVEPTLSAIRAVLRDLAEPVTVPQAQPHVIGLQTKDAKEGPLGLLFARFLAHMLAWGALILALPVGLGQATLFHLNGGDLADWD